MTEIAYPGEGRRLTLTWRSGEATVEETVELSTDHAAAEAFDVLRRLSPDARRETLVRQVLRTARRQPRSSGPSSDKA